MLEEVKKRIGVTGTFQNTIIQGYIIDVQKFLEDGGVSKKAVASTENAGIIARGVLDLWNYGSGDGSLSPWFIQRATQLSYKNDSDEVVDE